MGISSYPEGWEVYVDNPRHGEPSIRATADDEGWEATYDGAELGAFLAQVTERRAPSCPPCRPAEPFCLNCGEGSWFSGVTTISARCLEYGHHAYGMGRTVVVPLRPDADPPAAARRALAAVTVYLDRCKLSEHTVKAYKRQSAAYVSWLLQHTGEHPDAFVDLVGAEAAVTAWRRHLLQKAKASPSTVNQALAAVDLLYQHGPQLRIDVKRAQVPRPGEPDALTPAQEGAVERAARRRAVRDTAIIEILLHAGARVEECARLDLDDIAITARTGTVRLHGKGDEVRTVPLPARSREALTAWIDKRGNIPGPLWTGQRGRLTISGITQVVLAVGAAAGQPGLRPHRLRDTYATRLRLGGADPAQIQALMGHATLETTARYFRAGQAERQRVVEQVFD